MLVSVSGFWSAGAGLGSRAATETLNQTGGGRYTLFTTESRLESAGGLEARATWWLTRTIGVEGGGSWSNLRVVTRVSGDVEGAGDLTATSAITQYVIDGSMLVRLTALSTRNGRVVPFAIAGLGYLRQLYEGHALIETGRMYHAGGGVLVWFGAMRSGWLKRAGARAEGRWTVHDGGVTLGGDKRRAFGVLTAGAALQF
jgi:hypothetical protein